MKYLEVNRLRWQERAAQGEKSKTRLVEGAMLRRSKSDCEEFLLFSLEELALISYLMSTDAEAKRLAEEQASVTNNGNAGEAAPTPAE